MRCGGKLIISLLAGVSYDQLAKILQTDGEAGLIHHVLRVIPSIGAKINDDRGDKRVQVMSNRWLRLGCSAV